MTTVKIYGILSKEFSQIFSLRIRKVKEVVSAISANKPLFRNRIIELAKEGIHYAIVSDGKVASSLSEFEINKPPNLIELVPIICGRGVAAAIAGAGLMIGGAVVAGSSIAGAAIIGGLMGSLGGMLLGIGLQTLLSPKPEAPERQESTISGNDRSLMLSSKGNIAQQGSPVPVGYGRLRIGSSIIQASVRSYPLQDLSNFQASSSA